MSVGLRYCGRRSGRFFVGLYRDGLYLVFLQGGDPLVRRDLLGILQDLHEIGVYLTLIATGTKPTPDLVEQFDQLSVSLSISLDTLDCATYTRIRDADQLDKVLAGLDLLRHYRHQNFLTCIVSEVNRHEVSDGVGFARNRGFLPVAGAYHWDVGLYGKQDSSLMYERQEAGLVFGMLSVIIPAYNEGKALPGTLQALFAQSGEYVVIVPEKLWLN